VEGLGAAQFATGPTVDRLRSFSVGPGSAGPESESPRRAITLAATDPANPYGAALVWPLNGRSGAADTDDKKGHRPGRKAGAMVVIVDGRLALYVERGGKTMLTFGSDDETLTAAAESLAATVRRSLARLKVELADGQFVIGTPLGAALTAAGFSTTPQGLRLRG
jgi:ATP-dependent Lhr-like helicase